MVREKEPIVPKNPIDLSLKDESEEHEQQKDEKAVVNDQEISELLDNMGVASKKSEGWRSLIDQPKDFFQVMVQSVNESEKTIFVMEQKYEPQAVKLLRSVNRQIDASAPSLSIEEITEGGLYAAPYESVYYRAELIKLWKEKKTAKVRLVDYGNEIECKLSELKAPIPIMRNLNAYGFNVRPKTKQKVAADDVILIKIVDKADSRTFLAEIQPSEEKPEKNVVVTPVSPLQMILERGLIDCFISYIFPEKNAVLATFNDNKVTDNLKAMDKTLDSGDDFLTEVNVGEYIFPFYSFTIVFGLCYYAHFLKRMLSEL